MVDLTFSEMVCNLGGKCKRNTTFVQTIRQSANRARALQGDSELFECPSINFFNSKF